MRRIASVDVLRGLVIGLMVFVNSVAGVSGVPGFTQHLPGSVDGYSLADMIFPWFLFLVGVSLPLALGRAVADQRPWSALGRVGSRAAGLILLGVIFVNDDRIAADLTGLSDDAWLVMTVAAMAVLLTVRAADANRSGTPGELFPRWVKILAAVVLVALLIIYRGRTGSGRITWLRPSWWGILGLIGWAYLFGAVAFLFSRGRLWLLGTMQVGTVIVAIVTAEGHEGPLALLHPLLSPHDMFGSLTGTVIAGALAGVLLLTRGERALAWLAGYGGLMWIAGALLRPLHGYHKLGSTESWALVAAGQAALLLALFHLLVDRVWARTATPTVKIAPNENQTEGHPSTWRHAVAWLSAAGKNALFAYLLSEVLSPFCKLIGVSFTPGNRAGGAVAMANALAIAIFVLAIAAIATRRRIFLRV
jgi:heparan-alpha-glucosaminide N-acetyltransferase